MQFSRTLTSECQMRNLLQRNGRNPIMGYQNCIKNHTAHLEYIFHKIWSIFVISCLLFESEPTVFYWLRQLPWRLYNKNSCKGFVRNWPKYYLIKFLGNPSKHWGVTVVTLQHHFTLKSMGDLHAFLYCWWALNNACLLVINWLFPVFILRQNETQTIDIFSYCMRKQPGGKQKISYHITSYHTISYHIISYHIISYHIMSYHIISYHIISYHVISCHVISYHIISYHIISCHIISYHIISCHIMSYHIISYHIISYHIISYHIISYHIISYSMDII